MPDRDLILGVLGVQAGFVTPTQVMSAAATWLVLKDGSDLLQHLETSGALTIARRRLLEAMVDEAISASGGDEERLLDRLGGERAVKSTFGDASPLPEPARRSLADADRTVPEERPGQYSRFEELGRGAHSVVWRAVDEFVGREVALKVLAPPPDAQADSARARFLREARLVAQLDHPGIAAVHELVRGSDGTLFCAQKLVRGQTLKAKLLHCASLSERLELLDSLVGACHAVAYAHSRRVIHRDLKPSNIMVGDFGESVVVDWGLAKRHGNDETVETAVGSGSDPQLTTAGFALGTPSYMSPEQARGALAEIDERSDVFSLGVVLYELLTGRLPFEGSETAIVIERVLAGRYRPVRDVCPDAPAELAAVAHRALGPEKSARYAGAEELAAELTAYRAGGRVRAYEYPSWELLRRFILRNRALTSVSVLGVFVLIGAALIIAWQLHRTRVNLATSLIERAHAAEASFDWTRAAAYYAASRVQNDSREGQWGVALARAKLLPRILARRGAVDSALVVARRPDGRAIVVGKANGSTLFARDAEDGSELWSVTLPRDVALTRFTDGGRLVVLAGGTEHVIDPMNGADLESYSYRVTPCEHGLRSSHVALAPSGAPNEDELIADVPGGGKRTLLKGQTLWRLCAVSSDETRIAAVDSRGVVHVWNLATLDEIATRLASDVREIFYTPHGVALVRTHSIEVVAGPEGDFLIPIAGSGGAGLMNKNALGTLSPDGHLLAVPRLTGPQVDLVDLRNQMLVASLTFPPGAPRPTFSASSDRLYVAGLLEGSFVAAWDLRARTARPSIAGAPRMSHTFTDGGDRLIVHLDLHVNRIEVRQVDGTLVSTQDVAGQNINVLSSRDGRRFAMFADESISIRDATTGAVLSSFPCPGCIRFEFIDHTLITNNSKEIVLWDVDRQQPIWRETARVGFLIDPLNISPDERTVFWGRNGTVYIHTLGSDRDREVHIDDTLEDARPSHDGARLVIAGTHELGVWELDTLRPIFRAFTTNPVAQEVSWSRDDSALIHEFDGIGNDLVDSTTGKVFARILTSKPATVRANDLVSPDLHHALSRGGGTWEPYELPQPDTSPPADSLAKILAESGLEMQGAELIYSSSSVFR